MSNKQETASLRVSLLTVSKTKTVVVNTAYNPAIFTRINMNDTKRKRHKTRIIKKISETEIITHVLIARILNSTNGNEKNHSTATKTLRATSQSEIELAKPIIYKSEHRGEAPWHIPQNLKLKVLYLQFYNFNGDFNGRILSIIHWSVHCIPLQFVTISAQPPPPKKIPPTIVPGIQPVNQTAKFHEGQSTISRSLCF